MHNKNIELFGGRTSRNFGILNEYSLLFSNNPYPFDHYGFSVNSEKLKYSFYTTRLNNIRDLTKTINNLNDTVRELSRNLDSEIRISEAKNGKIELLHFKFIESRIKVKELKKHLASIKSIVK